MHIHTFDNGVRVHASHLLRGQLARYRKTNIHEPEEEAVFLEMVRSMPVASTLLNIGAGFGYYCILAKRERPDLHIYAAEPLARHRAYLGQEPGTQPYGARRNPPGGRGRLWGIDTFEDMRYGSRLLSAGQAPQHGIRAMLYRFGVLRIPRATVEVVTLDDCLRSTGPLGLCAMDVQGAEASVLRGYYGTVPVQSFLIGTHGESVHIETRALLREKGYRTLDRVTVPDQPDGMLAAASRK